MSVFTVAQDPSLAQYVAKAVLQSLTIKLMSRSMMLEKVGLGSKYPPVFLSAFTFKFKMSKTQKK
jgi:hypothetical protein